LEFHLIQICRRWDQNLLILCE